MTKTKKKLEFRYYTLPAGDYVLPKLGKGWEQEYGLGYEGMLHFHNLLEIGYCYHGNGKLIIEYVFCDTSQHSPYDSQRTGQYL